MKNNYYNFNTNMSIELKNIIELAQNIREQCKDYVFPGSYMRHDQYDYRSKMIEEIIIREVLKLLKSIDPDIEIVI